MLLEESQLTTVCKTLEVTYPVVRKTYKEILTIFTSPGYMLHGPSAKPRLKIHL